MRKNSRFFFEKLKDFGEKTQRIGSKSLHLAPKKVVNKKACSIRATRAKKCHIWCFSNRFSTKNSHFFKKLTLNLQNFRVFEKKTQGPWKKNSSIWGKNSSFLASKLNEPVVTNYTRYHKSVNKAWIKCPPHLGGFCTLFFLLTAALPHSQTNEAF